MTREAVTEHELTDEQIARLVTEAIAWDSRIHYSHIRVTVRGGVVYLGGTVERFAEKVAAEEDASRIAGVTQVISNVVVTPERRVGDKEIEDSLKRALARDARIDAQRIEVLVNNKVVTLRGEVITAAQKRAVLDDARLTYGVEGIVDQVIVIPEQPVSDHTTEEVVSSELARAPGLDEKRIHAHVQDGAVHLQGEVDFLYQKQEAERIAQDVPGVSNVRNELSIAHR